MAENPYWVNVQQKAFLRWCNDIFKKRDISISSLSEDFQDGTKLIELIEILTSKSIKHSRSPRMKVQKYENLTIALDFLKRSCNIPLVNIGPEDIYDGNLKLILGLIWALILHFKIKATEEGDNSDLLKWVNSKIPEFNIKNFTSDWQSGKALCALSNALLPDQTHQLLRFSNDPITDCTKGTKYATDKMNITQVMDVDDIVNHPDRHAMMTYITYFRDYDVLHQNLVENANTEMIPDIRKCKVYGLGLEEGNESGKETYFTVEVRNEFDRIIPEGGHKILVKVIGPHSQFDLDPLDKNDGTYYVPYTPTEDGNYVIEVTLGEQSLQNSPFYVAIVAPPPQTITEPEPHWFVFDPSSKKWVEYDTTSNDIIEKAFKQQNYGGAVEIMNKAYKIDMRTREEFNLSNKKLFGGFEKRPIVRGTWFWRTDEKNWAPYSEEIAVKLEQFFQEGKFDEGQRYHWNERGKKNRWVQFEGLGVGFRQFRQDGEKSEGREVTRGYLGRVIVKEVKK